MIIGTGIDIVEISRVRAVFQRQGTHFLNRILVSEEADYCLSYKDPTGSIAVRFAAKEALSKALGTGIGEEISWHDMWISRQAGGAPRFGLNERARRLMHKMGGQRVHVSLSHSQAYAVAVAIVEGEEGRNSGG